MLPPGSMLLNRIPCQGCSSVPEKSVPATVTAGNLGDWLVVNNEKTHFSSFYMQLSTASELNVNVFSLFC